MSICDKVFKLNIDTELLESQIDAVCNSNLPEDLKNGLHHLLGEIYDQCDPLPDFSFYYELSNKQVPLGEDFEKVLLNNINDLLVYDPDVDNITD